MLREDARDPGVGAAPAAQQVLVLWADRRQKPLIRPEELLPDSVGRRRPVPVHASIALS